MLILISFYLGIGTGCVIYDFLNTAKSSLKWNILLFLFWPFIVQLAAQKRLHDLLEENEE